MACLESDLNHQSPLLPRFQLEAEWAGILMDKHARPGQLALLLRSPAMVATRRAFEIPWVPVAFTRVETWTSYRGEDCENKQGRSLEIIQGEDCEKNQGRDRDIKQGVELGKESG